MVSTTTCEIQLVYSKLFLQTSNVRGIGVVAGGAWRASVWQEEVYRALAWRGGGGE